MSIKKIQRLRRALRSRMKMRELKVMRLSVHRTPRHIYAQLIDSAGNIVACASSLEETIKKAKQEIKSKVATAQAVGKLIATRALTKGIKKVAFDRSGFKYHGRIKALADAAREGGMEF